MDRVLHYDLAESRRMSLYFTNESLARENKTLYVAARQPTRAVLVVDSGLPRETANQARAYFKHYDCAVKILTVPGGEDAKTLEVCITLAKEISAYGLERRSEPVLLLGGGAVLDVGGLACSLYRRGVSYLRVPTTFLGMVDAGVGAKTAINVDNHKNLLGSFFPPVATVIDSSYLTTLHEGQIRSGFGEVFKYAVAADAELFAILEGMGQDYVRAVTTTPLGRELVERSARGHMELLATDIYESDLARVLDLGHTVGPHLEMALSELTHGEAVGIDVAFSGAVSHVLGTLTATELARILRLAASLGFRLSTLAPSPRLIRLAISERSTHRDGRLRLPIPSSIGSVRFIDDLDDETIDLALQALASLLNQRPKGEDQWISCS